MSGRLNGVQAKVKAECSESLYVHCSNHALDLVLQELAKEVDLIANALSFVKVVSVYINESHKRKSLFQSLFSSNQVVRNLLVRNLLGVVQHAGAFVLLLFPEFYSRILLC